MLRLLHRAAHEGRLLKPVENPGFGALVDRAHRCLILTRTFIVSVIVVIFGATRRVRGENQSLKLARGVWCWVCGGHAKIFINIRGSQVTSALWVSIRLCDFKGRSADEL